MRSNLIRGSIMEFSKTNWKKSEKKSVKMSCVLT